MKVAYFIFTAIVLLAGVVHARDLGKSSVHAYFCTLSGFDKDGSLKLLTKIPICTNVYPENAFGVFTESPKGVLTICQSYVNIQVDQGKFAGAIFNSKFYNSMEFKLEYAGNMTTEECKDQFGVGTSFGKN